MATHRIATRDWHTAETFDEPWEQYDLSKDLGQRNDLADGDETGPVFAYGGLLAGIGLYLKDGRPALVLNSVLAEGTLRFSIAHYFGIPETFGVGEDEGSPVLEGYAAGTPLPGTIRDIVFDFTATGPGGTALH